MTITNAVMIMFLFGCIQVAQCGVGIRTVADLTQAMYPHLPDSDACVRLLHRNGSAGCSTPGNSAVEGNLWRLSDRDMEAGSGQHIPRGSVAVLSAAALEDFLASLSADAAWASHWAGALVLAHAPGTHLPSNPLPASGALRPGSEAEAPSHAWNPAGTGSVLRALPIPGALHVHGADRGTLGTLRAAAAAVPGLRLAEASVGGLPPGSAAHSYRRVHPDLPLAVLTDYDAAWPSDAGTPTDGLDRLDVRALAVAAELVARAAHAWASSGGGDGDDTPGLSVDADSLEHDVAQLLACFGPQGLACPLAAAVLRGGAGPRAGPPSSYVGILRSLTKDSQASDPLVKGARERFLLGYLAYAAAGIWPEAEGYVPRGRPCSAASELQCPGGGVCVGAQTQDRSSECLNVTAKYVPAYPTALECRACDGQRAGGEGWHFTEAAATWEASFGWPEEDVWAESNWPTGTPSLSLLLRESAARERQVLLAGVGVALLCVAGVALLQKQARGWLPGAAGGDG
ncbi:NIS1 [Auxenochlorella protothecoides x Auxenochlorella symbiontica]